MADRTRCRNSFFHFITIYYMKHIFRGFNSTLYNILNLRSDDYIVFYTNFKKVAITLEHFEVGNLIKMQVPCVWFFLSV